MKQITFRKARREEIETVLLLLKEAALWLQKKGIDYWQDWISPPPHLIDWIKQGFEKNDFYMVEKNGDTIGCFRLQWQDPVFWGKQEVDAGYIHSFTISRCLAGQGIGRCVLGLIESYCRQNDKLLLRLDCGSDIKGLRNYYEHYGFKPVGEVTVLGERLTLYEKQIS
jgi:N-acetylglutamate synthase-like GNAT family acetyltransferase